MEAPRPKRGQCHLGNLFGGSFFTKVRVISRKKDLYLPLLSIAAAHTCLLFAHLKIVRNSESTQIHKSHYKQSLWVKIICIYGIFPITELKTNKFVRNCSIGIQQKLKNN